MISFQERENSSKSTKKLMSDEKKENQENLNELKSELIKNDSKKFIEYATFQKVGTENNNFQKNKSESAEKLKENPKETQANGKILKKDKNEKTDIEKKIDTKNNNREGNVKELSFNGIDELEKKRKEKKEKSNKFGEDFNDAKSVNTEKSKKKLKTKSSIHITPDIFIHLKKGSIFNSYKKGNILGEGMFNIIYCIFLLTHFYFLKGHMVKCA